jgi:hypothetical protein
MIHLWVQDRDYEISKYKLVTPTSYVGLKSKTSANTGCTSVTMELLWQFAKVYCIQLVYVTDAINDEASISNAVINTNYTKQFYCKHIQAEIFYTVCIPNSK